MTRRRKQIEPPAPGRFIRSKTGTPARLIKTRQYNDADEWLYRLDYGDVKSSGPLLSVSDLEAAGVTFQDERPEDLPEKIEPDEDYYG